MRGPGTASAPSAAGRLAQLLAGRAVGPDPAGPAQVWRAGVLRRALSESDLFGPRPAARGVVAAA